MGGNILNPSHPEWPNEARSLRDSDLKTRETRKRWLSYIRYRMTDGRILQRTVEFDELSELHDIVEKGPDFTKVTEIEITYNHARIDSRFIIEEFEVIR
jgi:hypothetical protein